MKISPVSFLYKNQLKQINFASSNHTSPISQKKVSNNYAEIPLYVYEKPKVKYSPYKEYSYNPIASVKPIEDLVGNYDNLDKFSELYAKKVNSNLLIPTEEDIEDLVLRIQKATNAKPELIRNVLYNLTFFGSYKSFDVFENLVNDLNIGEFGITDVADKNPITYDVSSNSAIEYLINSKEFIRYKGDKTGYILDNNSLLQLENYKNSSDKKDRKIFDQFLFDVENNRVIFFNIKGWDIKTKFNGYKNANFLSGSGYLENLAVEVIKRIQDGEKPNSIYYSDFKERLSNILDEIKPKIVDVDIKNENITNKDILKNISSKAIDKEQVKKYIENFIRIKQKNYSEKRVQEAILKYLDEQTIVYSIDSLSAALKNLACDIQKNLAAKGYDKDEIAYIIPECLKSFSIITAMYAQINGVDPKNINSLYRIPNKNLKKAKVILDDVSASGATEGKACYEYKINYGTKNVPLIYAPTVMCNRSENSKDRPYSSYPDSFFCDKYVYDLAKSSELAEMIKVSYNNDIAEKHEDDLKKYAKNYKVLNSEDLKILNDVLYKGYVSNGLCVMFPYMIPDNASDLASLLLGDLLYINNDKTNKLRLFLFFRRRFEQGDYDTYMSILNSSVNGF